MKVKEELGLVVVSPVFGASVLFSVSAGSSVDVLVQNMHDIVWMDGPKDPPNFQNSTQN